MNTNQLENMLAAEVAESKADDPVILLSDAAEEQKKNINFSRYPIGIPSFDQYAKLDEEQGGLAGGELMIVSGPTGNGKTLLASTIAYNLLTNQGIPTLFLTYEVSVFSLWKSFEKMGAKPGAFICAPASHTTGKLEWVEKKIKEAKEKYMIGNVVIDHLGFLVPFQKPNQNMSQNYSSFLSQIVRELKTIAVKENISIILPVHMVKSATDDPSLRDIGHSGGIAQESDFTLLIAREEATKSKAASDMGHDYYTKYAKVIMAKNRPGGKTPSFWMQVEDGKLVETWKETQSKMQQVFG
jgi:replicative DNA helicase